VPIGVAAKRTTRVLGPEQLFVNTLPAACSTASETEFSLAINSRCECCRSASFRIA
jgi:hypothetical protein